VLSLIATLFWQEVLYNGKVKITNGNQSHNSCKKYSREVMQTRISNTYQIWDQVPEGVTIPCWLATSAVNPHIIYQENGAIRGQSRSIKNNLIIGQMAKIPTSDQSQKHKQESQVIEINGRTRRTPGHTGGWIRCLGGVSIPILSAVSPVS
jgi:hypothetical protein